MSILIRNGLVLDPCTRKEEVYDILTEGGRILKIARPIQDQADQVIDAAGYYVMPGFIDLHVHLRDPGQEYKETIETGCKAAAKGGVTTVCAMPNTKPVIDSAEKVADVHSRAKAEGCIRVIQIGAVTKEQEGKELADIKGMAQAGCRAISEDGKSVMDESLYKRAMQIAKESGVAVFAHCEDRSLANGGVMNADERSVELGLPGIRNEVEDVIVERDIRLSEETGARLHLCHCSTKDSVRLLKKAKENGLPVTGEVCPHHFTLTTKDIPEDDGNFKMNPPLRKSEDVEALKAGLRVGIVDAVSTDHAPHSAEEKNTSFQHAMFGIVGLETLAALTYTELVDTKVLTPLQMVEKLSYNPSKILGIPECGSIQEGKVADLVVFDPDKVYTINRETFVSKGKNTPFHGRRVKGEVVCTIAGGKVVYQREMTGGNTND